MPTPTPTTIIPVAGGKGGVGKSFITASVAIALAQSGDRTVAVDLDLGNSNLHSLLGLENSYAGVGDYLKNSMNCLPEQLIVETGIPNLGFIPGDARMPFMANLKSPEKTRLLKFLRGISARYVLLDLSAGTAFNTLDLFRLGSSGIVVTTPEHPALMSALVFVKHLVLRAISEALRRRRLVKEMLRDLQRQNVNDPVFSVRTFRDEVARVDPVAAERVSTICANIRPRFVYNMLESHDDTQVFENVDATCADALSIECDHIGAIPYDVDVRKTMRQSTTFMLEHPQSETARAIDRIGSRIIKLWDTPLKGSASLLAQYAGEVLTKNESDSD